MRVELTLMVAFAAGCFDPKLNDEPFLCGPGDACPPDYSCSDGVCVREPADGGPGGPCQIGTMTCDGDTLVTCPSGTRQETNCPVGCAAGRCLVLVPTDLPSSTCSAPVSGTLRISSDRTFDTDACEGGVKIDAPPRCVVTVAQLTIDPHATLTVTGSRIPVLVATDMLRLLGTIDVGGNGIVSGPGYAAEIAAGRGETADANSSKGGGGAGHATKGGQAGANPGEAYGDVELSPILPGASGGGGGMGCLQACPLVVASGGGAGGAIHIVACRDLELDADTTVSAGGGGGPGGHGGAVLAPPGGGGGGGSGGSILIEAPRITVVAGAGIGANGGGGGGGGARGADFTGPSGEAGENGSVSPQPARGGSGGDDPAGDGGDGGTADGQGSGMPPGRGGDDNAGGGGGGGGAAGRIRLNSRSDQPPSVAGVVSPAPSIGSIERR